MKQDKFDKIGPYFNIAYKYTTYKLTREQSGQRFDNERF